MTIGIDKKATLDAILEACMHRITVGIAVALKYTSVNWVLNILPALRSDKSRVPPRLQASGGLEPPHLHPRIQE